MMAGLGVFLHAVVQRRREWIRASVSGAGRGAVADPGRLCTLSRCFETSTRDIVKTQVVAWRGSPPAIGTTGVGVGRSGWTWIVCRNRVGEVRGDSGVPAADARAGGGAVGSLVATPRRHRAVGGAATPGVSRPAWTSPGESPFCGRITVLPGHFALTVTTGEIPVLPAAS